MHKHLVILIAILQYSNIIQAQDGYFKINSLSDSAWSSHYSFEIHFPIISSNIDSNSALKINQTMQLQEFHRLEGNNIKTLLNPWYEVINRNKIQESGFFWMDYKVTSNTSSYLSIWFSEATSGGFTSYWHSCFNFNTGNGDLIQLNDIFIETGLKIIKQEAQKKVLFTIKNDLETNKEKEPNALPEDVITNLFEHYTGFYFTNDSICIDYFNNISKQYKTFVRTHICLSINDIKPYLNDYGKSLLGISDKSVSDYRSSSFPQVFKGTIGNESVILILNPTDWGEEDQIGIYAYTKYGMGLYIKGKREGDNYSANETNDRDNSINTGRLEFTLINNIIIGTWTSPDGKNQYPIHLTR